MMEVGPWRWDGKSEQDFWVQPGGWDEYTTVVYGKFSMMENISFISCINKVDQPAGTGFSYTSTDRYVHTTDIVGSSTFARRLIRPNLPLSGSATVDRISEELLRGFS